MTANPFDRKRPAPVVVAAALLIVTGGAGMLGSVWLLYFGAVFAVPGACLAAAGGVAIIAGVQCLRLREPGRILGLAIAATGIVVQLVALRYQPATSIVAATMSVFIVWALHTRRQAFRVPTAARGR